MNIGDAELNGVTHSSRPTPLVVIKPPVVDKAGDGV